MASQWLTEGIPSPTLSWVSISDPGVSGHEGFIGEMSKYETTNAQYCEYLNAAKASGDIRVEGNYVKGNSGPYSGQDYYNLAGAGYTYNGATDGGAARIVWTGSSFTVVDAAFENHPVTYVTWYGSTAFAGYYGWRLPTEWEWQAVADFDGTYSYGHGPGAIENHLANFYNSAHPYGTTAAGAYAMMHGYEIAHMAGNVWEWTSSCYYEDCSYGTRVLRGGGWDNPYLDCSVLYRSSSYPNIMYHTYGFRVCR
jgi:formylglycine-generating enzyme required for sulfatase activity